MSTCSQFPLLSLMVTLPGGRFVGLGSRSVGFRPSTCAAWFVVDTFAHIWVLVWSLMGVGSVVGVGFAVTMMTMIPTWWQFCIAFVAFAILDSAWGAGVLDLTPIWWTPDIQPSRAGKKGNLPPCPGTPNSSNVMLWPSTKTMRTSH